VHHVELNSIGSKTRCTEIGCGGNTGSVSTSAEASGDGTIWPGKRSVAGLGGQPLAKVLRQWTTIYDVESLDTQVVL